MGILTAVFSAYEILYAPRSLRPSERLFRMNHVCRHYIGPQDNQTSNLQTKLNVDSCKRLRLKTRLQLRACPNRFSENKSTLRTSLYVVMATKEKEGVLRETSPLSVESQPTRQLNITGFLLLLLCRFLGHVP